MSNFPGEPPRHRSPYQQVPDPRGPSQQQPPGPHKTSGLSPGKILLIVGAMIGVTAFAFCCVCGSVIYFGMQVDSDQIASSIEDDPNVTRELGMIDSCSINWVKTGNHPDDEVFVYDVKGSKGEGLLYVTDNLDEVTNVELKTENGTWTLEIDQSKFEY